jgi:hypothetical protein
VAGDSGNRGEERRGILALHGTEHQRRGESGPTGRPEQYNVAGAVVVGSDWTLGTNKRLNRAASLL